MLDKIKNNQKKYRRNKIIGLFFTVISGFLLTYIVKLFYSDQSFNLHLIEISGLDIRLKQGSLQNIFAITVASLYFVSSIYSTGYMSHYKTLEVLYFNMYYLVSIIITLSIAYSANLLTIFIFYELLTLFTYPLVAFYRNPESMVASRKYIKYLFITSLCLLMPAILYIIYLTNGNVDFVNGGIMMGVKISPILSEMLFLIMLYGVGKMALFPLHGWLPSAMVAPTPVSALLHGLAVVKSGAFVIIMITFNIFGANYLNFICEKFMGYNWITWIGVISIIYASLKAFKVDSIKERLAYSTIAQLGYIIVIISSLGFKSSSAAMIQIFAHAIAKVLLFFSAGYITYMTGKKYVSNLNGLWNIAPLGFLSFGFGILSIVGFPFLIGFYSKYAIILDMIKNNNFLGVGVISISSVMSFMYLIPIVYNGFFKSQKEDIDIQNHSPNYFICCAIILMILINIMLFFDNILESKILFFKDGESISTTITENALEIK